MDAYLTIHQKAELEMGNPNLKGFMTHTAYNNNLKKLMTKFMKLMSSLKFWGLIACFLALLG